MSDIVDRARRNAKVIYIAVAESVADEISGVFVDCADEIDRLRAALATAEAERDDAQTRLRGLAESLQAAGHEDLASVFRVTHERDAARRAVEMRDMLAQQDAGKIDALTAALAVARQEHATLRETFTYAQEDIKRLQQERDGLIAQTESAHDVTIAQIARYGHLEVEVDTLKAELANIKGLAHQPAEAWKPAPVIGRTLDEVVAGFDDPLAALRTMPAPVVYLSEHPLVQQTYDLVRAIDGLPASLVATALVNEAGSLFDLIKRYVASTRNVMVPCCVNPDCEYCAGTGEALSASTPPTETQETER